MNIIIKKLIVHNFLSFGHSEVNLEDKHFCLVKGINNNPRDNALSNGSGKSSWGSAICWALTGKTISGLSKNLKNINVAENSCYVTLFFTVDKDCYEITRYHKPKSDLRIKLNNQDISGKTLTESEIILSKYLPDLTDQLIASIIILGQGLPQKFTDNKPSGRKQILEQLSKSDFMIQDLKNRIDNRLTKLNTNLKDEENKQLVLNTQILSIDTQLKKLETKLASLSTEVDFDSQINLLKDKIATVEKSNQEIQTKIDLENDNTNKLKENLNEINNQKNNALSETEASYNIIYKDYLTKKSQINVEINTLKNKIKELENIKDICPTCGQKLPNVIKPSTQNERLELQKLNENLTVFENGYKKDYENYLNTKNSLSVQYNEKTKVLNESLNSSKQTLADLHGKIDNNLVEYKLQLNKLEIAKDTHQKNLQDVKDEIAENRKNKDSLITQKAQVESEIIVITEHIAVVNKMNTLVKRDFRTYLLKDIIDYIDRKAKEYSKTIFKNTDLNFVLDGNNIEITYCDKDFENLSGGEKQRIDLIIQFAIRDMLSKYLGFSSNILILDEIFDNLDAIATTSVLDLIINNLNDVESIFIISHHADELDIPNDCTLLVEKNEQGISTIKYC